MAAARGGPASERVLSAAEAWNGQLMSWRGTGSSQLVRAEERRDSCNAAERKQFSVPAQAIKPASKKHKLCAAWVRVRLVDIGDWQWRSW